MTPNRIYKVNHIYVIESLRPADPATGRPGDLRTGTSLYETTLAQRTQHNRDFGATRYEPKSKDEFLAVLAQIARDCEDGRRMPMIQIDAHGCVDGLEVGAELLSWREMKEGTQAINAACRNNLVVALAACEGIHLISVIRVEERAAAFAVISTAQCVDAPDIEVSFRAFYEELFRSRDLDAAIRQLNEALPGARPRYAPVFAERMFIVGFQAHVIKHLGPTFALEWSESIDRRSGGAKNLDPGETIGRREGILRHLVDGAERRFEEYREKFFMIDLDPANRDRFPVAFDQIKMPAGIL